MSKSTDELYDMYVTLVEEDRYPGDIARYCIENPKIVADLVFEDRSSRVIKCKDKDWEIKMRYDLIFGFSPDGGCSAASSPKWASFMRTFIIPRAEELGEKIAMSISWYQEVHGL